LTFLTFTLVEDKRCLCLRCPPFLSRCEECFNAYLVYLFSFRPEAQLTRAREQHSMLVSNLQRQSYNRVHVNTIICGVMGTIYTHYTDSPLKSLELLVDHYLCKKVTKELNKHSIKHATRLIQTRYALQYSKSP